jgi:hypothetical protein
MTMIDGIWHSFVRNAITLVIVAHLSRAVLLSQIAPEETLKEAMASEQQHGPVLTYVQSYTDDQDERVSYTGTLYTGIRFFRLEGCEVTTRIVVQDRFSGTIEHKNRFGRAVSSERTGDLSDDTIYEYRFSLSDLKTDEIHDIRAKPAQLNTLTSFHCEEDRSCDLSWVSMTAPGDKIVETRTVNGNQDLHTSVRSAILPMTSPQIAANVAKLFHDASLTCAGHKSY